MYKAACTVRSTSFFFLKKTVKYNSLNRTVKFINKLFFFFCMIDNHASHANHDNMTPCLYLFETFFIITQIFEF